MMNLRKGLILILSSPSGGGKSSLCKELLKIDGNLKLSVSMTTRAPRACEIEGVHYYFDTVDRFQDLITQNYFLEYAQNYGNFYGTPLSYSQELLLSGKDVLFDIDWKGAKRIKEKIPERVVSIFILPPDLDVLKQRLQTRGQDTETVINNRMIVAKEEISHASEYDYTVVNDDLLVALKQIKSILTAERVKSLNSENLK